LTGRECAILELLLTVDVDGIHELRRQVPHARAARWSCGCASFNLIVDKAHAQRSTITRSPLSEAWSKERNDSDRCYELLLWVEDGWLAGVEIVDFVHQHGEQSPQEVPPLPEWDVPRLVEIPGRSASVGAAPGSAGPAQRERSTGRQA
jgi:hypothetical protein